MLFSGRVCSVNGKRKYPNLIAVAAADSLGDTIVLSKNHEETCFFARTSKIILAYKAEHNKERKIIRCDNAIVVVQSEKIKVLCLEEDPNFQCQPALQCESWDNFIEKKKKDWSKESGFEQKPSLLYDLG